MDTSEGSTDDAPFVLCVLLWAHPGREQDLVEYEDRVLQLLADHGGRVRERLRAPAGDDDGPVEVQLLELPGETALAAYLQDARRTALSSQRDRAVARTDVHRFLP